jgi:hypothetical protein
MRRTFRVALPCVVLLPFLVACGGAGSSGSVALPTASVSFSPSIGFPTPTRTPTRTPSEPDTSPPGPTSAPTSEPTSPPPTRTRPPQPTPTDEPTTQAPTSEPPKSKPPKTQAPKTQAPATSAAAEPSPSPTESPAAAPTESQAAAEESGSDWWWLLIPILGVAAIVALLLRRQARIRRAWEAELSEAEAEVGWFARDLIPQLRGAGTPEGVAGGWAVAAPRVGALDDRLSQVAATAPGEEERGRAGALQQAVRTARDRVVAVVDAGDASAQWALDLDDAQAPLLAVLVPQATGAEGQPSAP